MLFILHSVSVVSHSWLYPVNHQNFPPCQHFPISTQSCYYFFHLKTHSLTTHPSIPLSHFFLFLITKSIKNMAMLLLLLLFQVSQLLTFILTCTPKPLWSKSPMISMWSILGPHLTWSFSISLVVVPTQVASASAGHLLIFSVPHPRPIVCGLVWSQIYVFVQTTGTCECDPIFFNPIWKSGLWRCS